MAAPRMLVVFSSLLAESSGVVRRFAARRGFRELAAGFGDVGALLLEIVAHRAAQRRIGDVVRRMGGLRQVAARQLVLALGAGLDHGEAARDRKVDGLVIADLEMQERMMLD